jgi:hypothetical protein
MGQKLVCPQNMLLGMKMGDSGGTFQPSLVQTNELKIS